ncbi:MAG: glycosyltransferase family 4 protein [Zetaproteobacteria bacterium]|nr:glycosyltransferase family 4 protein [Zetaproteobacteria bacterium]
MRTAFVVQRYGERIVGGAEEHARQVAERLVKKCGYEVDIYTTTAINYRTWENALPSGASEDAGVRVFRFQSTIRRYWLHFGIINQTFKPILRQKWWRSVPGLSRLLFKLEDWWYKMQGPYCPELLKALGSRQDQYQQVFFFTYLYYPCAYGIEVVHDKAVLIPTAHHEAPFFFSRTEKVMESVSKILANSEAEARLICKTYPSVCSKVEIAGMGLDHALAKCLHGDIADNLEKTLKLPQRGYLIYLGRLSRGKGVDRLIREFATYINRTGRRLHLFLAGAKDQFFDIPSHPQISYVGVLTEEEKWQFIASALAVVNPSPKDSLSLLVLEAMMMRTPVIVNPRNPVLANYAANHDSVFAYRNGAEFAEILDVLNSADWSTRSEKALSDSQTWVRETYSWERVLGIYQKSLLDAAV